MDSPNPAFDDQPALASASSEADAPLEKGIPTRGPSNVDGIGEGAPSGVVAALTFPPRPADTKSSRKRSPNQVLLSTYIPPRERVHPLAGMVALI